MNPIQRLKPVACRKPAVNQCVLAKQYTYCELAPI